MAGALVCSGADQLTVTCPFPEVVVRFETAPACASGIVIAAANEPVPRLVTAATRKVYVWPLVNPEIVYVVDVPPVLGVMTFHAEPFS